MIDTIAFKIKVTPETIAKIKQSVFTRTRRETFNCGEFVVEYDFFNTEFQPSYDRKIKLRIDDRDNYLDFYSGFSLPKYVYGHNCYMLYDYKAALNEFRADLSDYYRIDVPEVGDWILNRVDVCYNFLLASNEDVKRTIDHFKTFEYPRKKPHVYKGSVYYASRAYTFKIYDKAEEYLVNDYKTLIKNGREKLAREIFNIAGRILRVETEMRKPALKYHFKKEEVKISDLSYDFFYERLNFYFSKFLSMGGENLSDIQVYHQLKTKFDSNKAANLYIFWTALMRNKEMVRKMYIRQTFYRHMRDLKKAKISLVSIETNNNIDLTIPSKHCSNVVDLWERKAVKEEMKLAR